MENTVKEVNILSKKFYDKMFSKEFNDKLDKMDSSVSFLTRFERLKKQLTQTVPPTTVPNTSVGNDQSSDTPSDTASDPSTGELQVDSNVETTE